MPTPLCQQAAVVTASNRPLSLWDPFTENVEVNPPVPRPADPPAPVITGRTWSYQNPLTVGWEMTDAYWWALLVLSTGVNDPQYAQQILAARGPYSRFNFLQQPPDSQILQVGWAQMSDRFCVFIGGTDNRAQALQYALTHSVGLQLARPYGYVNMTFGAQAQLLASLIVADYVAAGRPPLLVAGHSYGAAVAPMVAFELLGRPPTMFDRIASFASPKIATSSLKDSLAFVQYLRFVNRADPVPTLPPPQSIIQPLAGPAALGGYPGGDYREAGPILLLNPRTGFDLIQSYDQSASAWVIAWLGMLNRPAEILNHFARSYVDVIRATLPPLALPQLAGWLDYPSLDQVDANLRSIGL